MCKRILILGGTGAMGRHLVSLLEDTDNEVIVTSRSLHKSYKNIKYVQGNAHDMDFVKPLMKNGANVVVNFMIYNTLEFSSVIDIFLDNCKQYIHLSSARVYSDVEEIITEDTPRLLDVTKDDEYLATDEYALTKAKQEDMLRSSGKRNYTIVRPYITYSDYRLQLGVNEKETWLYRALKGHKIVFSEDVATKYTTLTYGLDVARGIVALIGKEDALGEAFHITTDESIKWKDVLTLYQDVLETATGTRPKVCMQKYSPNLIGWGKWQVKYDRWYNRKFDNTKIKGFIDTTDFETPYVGLKRCLTTFLENPIFNNINWRKEGQLDRLSHEMYFPFNHGNVKDFLKYHLTRTGIID